MARVQGRVIRLWSVVFGVVVLCGATSVRAQDTPQDALAGIREQLLHADYRAALEAVTAFVDRDDLDAAEHNAGLEVLATIHIALRHDADAEAVLSELYSRDPGHRLSDPDASPPVIAAFGRARANPPEPLPTVLADRTAPLSRRVAPTIAVEVVQGVGQVSEVRLRYRQGDAGYTAVVMAVEGTSATARVPVIDEASAYDVDYVVEARAPSGHVLATVGSDEDPAQLVVPAREVVAVSTGPGEATTEGGSDDGLVIGVVLGVVGALLVAGAIVTGVLVADEVSGPPDGSLGNIDLPLLRF